MSDQPTKGPWRTQAQDGFAIEVWSPLDPTPGSINNFVVAHVQHAPDAQLIAAAPELHTALYALANYFEVHTMDTGRTSRGEEVWQAARAALAKARDL